MESFGADIQQLSDAGTNQNNFFDTSKIFCISQAKYLILLSVPRRTFSSGVAIPTADLTVETGAKGSTFDNHLLKGPSFSDISRQLR